MANHAAKRWCLTINNAIDADIEATVARLQVKYAVFGIESGREGTRHLQGYIHLVKKVRFTGIKKIFPTAHIERAHGSDVDNAIYCRKEDNILLEVGQPQEGDESGGDAGKLRKAMKRRLDGDTKWDVANDEDIGGSYIHAMRNVEQLVQEKKQFDLLQNVKTGYANVQWRVWQTKLLLKLTKFPDQRTIMWYWENMGNVGKSFLATYLATVGAFVTQNAKTSDIAHAYQGQDTVVFDYSRTMEERVNYDVLESVKNGRVFSPKYDSKVKLYNIPHVVVFANFPPEETKMSADRWDIVAL